MGWLEPVYANIPLTKVYDKTFTNQVVVIDGKDFIDCTFNGVTFRYNGGYYLFEGARIEGAIAIDTPNDTAGNAINLLTWLDSHTQNHALVERWKKTSTGAFQMKTGHSELKSGHLTPKEAKQASTPRLDADNVALQLGLWRADLRNPRLRGRRGRHLPACS